MSNCDACGRDPKMPHEWETLQPIPHKANGWVGDKFVPYEKHYRGARVDSRILCGMCFVEAWLAQPSACVESGYDNLLIEIVAREVGEYEPA